MKGWALSDPASVETRPLELYDLPRPEPDADEILVKVSVCGICRTDLHVVEGDLAQRQRPVVPGHQIVGRVAKVGESVTNVAIGDRVGIAWLGRTCGKCRFCISGRENLCLSPRFTGWTIDGGFAEYAVVSESFAYPIPEGFSDLEAAPLLCAGIIGYRALRLTMLGERGWSGARLGIYGFGAAGHVAIQLARARGAEVYVATRDRERHQTLAGELGATWVGDAYDTPPAQLDASIIFAPAGELMPAALKALDKGGVLVLGGIHMSNIPSFPYSLLYGERTVRSVANNTRDDGREFLDEASRVPIKTHVEGWPFDQANEALIALKHDAIKGAGVVEVGSRASA